MLRFLRVRNFALIGEIEIQFEPGLNLLTGETGAGKSLVVDALNLIRGEKASSDLVRSGETRAVIEAVFEADIAEALDAAGLDRNDDDAFQVIIRREISSDERNRVFINNQPATLALLRQLSPALLDIHGQHEQQTLFDSENQLAFVDACAESSTLAGSVRRTYQDLRSTEQALEELRIERARHMERADALAFQQAEIMKLAPRPGEAAELLERVSALTHAEKLREAAERAYDVLYESEHSIVSSMAQLEKSIRDVRQYDSRLNTVLEQIETARIATEEVAREVRRYAAGIESNPNDLDALQTRLAELERLHRKFGPDLHAHLEKVTQELDSIGLDEERQIALTERLRQLQGDYRDLAERLSRQRREAAAGLQKTITRQLRGLGMPQARFALSFENVGPRATGIDQVDFQFSANPGEDLHSLKRVASGGELSRVMLALRSVLAEDGRSRTLVFDEIDAGIGGQAAETVGRQLKKISKAFQVLCVTHLAQVAAFADVQFRIEKVVERNRTATRVTRLEGVDRIDELARMMSGAVSDAARRHVQELLARSSA